ncbi:MAG: NADH:ubiquinone reductase (Na(+)-transporting) subunit C, partial [Flavobacteriia bacterium]|nr:NADH:ubiquinone reductase (Na(+)-transporting) subunit C [Flavobacteriia bacterium]
MKMDVNSNGYTFGFAAVLVIVVAALLSFTATSLQERQEENVAQEKKQNILASIGLQVERADAAQAYEENISKEMVIQGDQKIEGLSAFGVDMAEELKKAPSERMYPLFIANYKNATSY